MSRVIRYAAAPVAIRPASATRPVSVAIPARGGHFSGDESDRRLAAAVQAHLERMGGARFVQMARAQEAEVPADAGFGRFRDD